jgi:hypothetical protein
MTTVINQTTPPDEKAFRAHTSAGRFPAGVDAGQWRLISIGWPLATIAVSAAPRAGAPDEYFFQFELGGYPNVGATARVWSPVENRLATEPERPKVNFPGLPSPFRSDWMNGSALYLACDRIAASSHPDWAVAHAGDLWEPKEGINKYLIRVYEILHGDAYTGL